MNTSLVDCLLDTLNNERINYCHWKSNIDLDQATSGEMDLDFLIERESFQPTVAILSRLGFKPALVRWGANSPGISHFYGYDPLTDRYAHVHLFSRVLTGESFMKSHLLPLEAMLLQNPRFEGNMRVTSKSAELVLFTIRTFIKYGSLLDLTYLYKKADKLRYELEWLKRGSDPETALCLLKKYCPVIDEDLFLECLESLEHDSSLVRRIRLAGKVRSRIRGYAKHSGGERIAGLARLAVNQVQRRVGARKKKKNKVFQAGGAIIAVVGPDATGKSTVVAETGKWLGENFLVRVVHAGKPPSSLLTAPVNAALGLARRLGAGSPRAAQGGEGGTAPGKARGLASLLAAMRAVALAWDRRSLLLKSWRDAARGELVICDRYPSSITGAMDSPRLREDPDGRGWISAVYNRAARLEASLYQQIPPPDIVIRLQVPVEVALERNRLRRKPGEEPDEYIEARHALSAQWQRPDTQRIFDVDTAPPLPQTLRTIKEIIWRAL